MTHNLSVSYFYLELFRVQGDSHKCVLNTNNLSHPTIPWKENKDWFPLKKHISLQENGPKGSEQQMVPLLG